MNPSGKIASFFKRGLGWAFTGGASEEPRKRPVGRLLLTLGMIGLMGGLPVTDAFAKDGKKEQPVVLAPIYAPPPKPEYSQDQKNRWYEEAYHVQKLYPSEFSRFIKQMNDRFGNIDSDQQILIFDPDHIYAADGMASSANNGYLHLRNYANKYIWWNSKRLFLHEGLDAANKVMITRGGVALHGNVTDQFMYKKHGHQNDAKLCMVFPRNPDTSGMRDAADIAALNPKAITKIGGQTLQEAFPKDLMRRWTVYHEAGHCQDDFYIPEAINSEGAGRAARLAQAETFADIYSVLLLAQEGHMDFAGKLARLRLLTPAGKGRELMRQCANNPFANFRLLNQSWAAVGHYSEPALTVTQDYITKTGRAELQKMTNEQLIAKAKEITEAHSFLPNELAALRAYLLSGDKFIEHLKTRAAAGDTRDARRLEIVQGFIARADRALTESVVPGGEKLPIVEAFTDEAPVLKAWEQLAERIWRKGGDFYAFAGEYTKFRDEMRREIYAGQGDTEMKSVILTEILVRTILGDDLGHDVFHLQYLPTHNKAQPRWKVRDPNAVQPAPTPTEPTNCQKPAIDFDEMFDKIDRDENQGLSTEDVIDLHDDGEHDDFAPFSPTPRLPVPYR
jgi:hypothetical protein